MYDELNEMRKEERDEIVWLLKKKNPELLSKFFSSVRCIAVHA